MAAKHVVIIGAGIGGLAAAVALSTAGLRVTILERGTTPGGKLRSISVAGHTLDAGPTVLTGRAAIDAVFNTADEDLEAHLTLTPAETISRNFWPGSPYLDLHADRTRSAEAIAAFATPRDAAAYLDLCRDAERIHTALDRPFLRQPRPSGLLDLIARIGVRLPTIQPTRSFAAAVAARMHDPRLRQMFGQFSTEHGTLPHIAPAAALLLLHMRLTDSWIVDGGMATLVTALAALAQRTGVALRLESAVREIVVTAGRATGVRLDDGEILTADAVVMNGDPAALASGMLGTRAKPGGTALPFPRRSLSAVTWATMANVRDAPLARDNTIFPIAPRPAQGFFADGLLSPNPIIRLSAQDRDTAHSHEPGSPERLLLQVDAPANGDRRSFSQVEVDHCMQSITALLSRCGIDMAAAVTPVLTTPAIYHRLYPGAGGALHGPALQGWSASLRRPAARTGLRGLYLAGGSTHPGPGIGLAALSGLQAAHTIVLDIAPQRRVAGRSPAITGPAPLPGPVT